MNTVKKKIQYPQDPAAQVLWMKYKGRTRARKSMLAILAKLQDCSKKKDQNGYFDVPSMVLIKIRKNYKRYIEEFKDAGILEVYTSKFLEYAYCPDDIFNEDVIERESYSTRHNQCKKYRFCYDKSYGHKSIQIDATFKPTPWFEIIESSLLAIGVSDIRIARDQFSRRLHHNLSAKVDKAEKVWEGKDNYKNYLRTNFPGQYTIVDAIACQPTLMPEILKVYDKEYSKALNSHDFYTYIADSLNIDSHNSREEAKNIFNLWAMNPGYITSELNTLFPVMTRKKLKEIGNGRDKNISKKLQRAEAKYFIDNALNNIKKELGITFCITIHDSMIVENKFANLVKDYLIKKTPFKFSTERL